MTARMPAQKPGRSKQDYGTPWALIHAINRRFGPLGGDLAAHRHNHKVASYLDESMNSLTVDWADWLAGGIGWLNPPFATISPWAKKCVAEGKRGARIILLTPASVGANWFVDVLWPNAAKVMPLTPRLTFEGESMPYPKDCMLTLLGPWPLRGLGPVFEPWRWR